MSAPYHPNFVVNLPYRNKLPSAPYGPYFKNVDILTHLKDEFPEYRTSTIEKNYVWQPHLGPLVGIDIDLVDQESILVADVNAQQNLAPSDRKYLHYSSNEKGKGKSSKASFDEQTKPWWLRNTTYMENNPFNVQSKIIEEDPGKRTAELKKKLAEPHLDHFSQEYVERTFSSVDETIKRLEAQNKNKKIVYNIPVLPLEDQIPSSKKRKRIHSLVRFDEDPKVVVNVVTVQDDEQTSKKYKIDDSIATNVREPLPSKDGATTVKGLEVTLVAPAAKDDSYNRKKTEHLFEWVKDYRMEIHTDPLGCNFIFLLDEEDKEQLPTKVKYFPIASRVDMKKLTLDNSMPQDCLVVREDS